MIFRVPRLGMLFAFVLAYLPRASGASGQAIKCDVQGLTIEESVGTIPVKLTNATYYLSSHDGPAYVDVRITNMSAPAIAQIVLVIEYSGDSRKLFGQITLAGLSSPMASEHRWVVHAEHNDDSFSEPLAIGVTRTLKGVSSSVSTGCPTRARLTFLGLQFDNHSAQTWVSPDWKVSPVLNYFPDDLNVTPAGNIGGNVRMSVRVKIDKRGQIAQIDQLGGKPLLEGLALFDQLRTWTFFPAIAAGEPVPSELTIIFQFISDPESGFPVDSSETKFPTIHMKATPYDSLPNKWRLFCTWRYGGSRLE
jgi:hypothetical protein